MWDDIIIGEGNKGNTAISCNKGIKFSIAQNSVSYWISSKTDFNFGLTIFKNTSEAAILANLLIHNSDDTIDNYITEVILKNIDAITFYSFIKRIKERSSEEGMKTKQIEILKVLGFN